MPKDIAVYVNESGETVSFYEQGIVKIYERKQGQWNLSREKEFSLGNSFTMKDLRAKMKDVMEFIGQCKIFVGLSITGVPYFELEKAKCSVWEYEGKPVDFLDYVLENEEAEEKESMEQKNAANIGPVETFPGCYRLSLKEIQEKNVGVTSKQALLTFIRQGKFYQLEVICNHIPPWLEAELQIGNLEGRSEILGRNEIKVIITKKTCQQC